MVWYIYMHSNKGHKCTDVLSNRVCLVLSSVVYTTISNFHDLCPQIHLWFYLALVSPFISLKRKKTSSCWQNIHNVIYFKKTFNVLKFCVMSKVVHTIKEFLLVCHLYVRTACFFPSLKEPSFLKSDNASLAQTMYIIHHLTCIS